MGAREIAGKAGCAHSSCAQWAARETAVAIELVTVVTRSARACRGLAGRTVAQRVAVDAVRVDLSSAVRALAIADAKTAVFNVQIRATRAGCARVGLDSTGRARSAARQAG